MKIHTRTFWDKNKIKILLYVFPYRSGLQPSLVVMCACFLVSLQGSQKTIPPAYRKTSRRQNRFKIAPCGRKKIACSKSCLEDSTIRNPVHTRETRMCGGYSANPHYCLEGSTSPIRYSLPDVNITWVRWLVLSACALNVEEVGGRRDLHSLMSLSE